MLVKQIASIVNKIYHETTGESAIVNEDLSFINEGMTTDDLLTALTSNGVDNYVKSLIDHIGKVIFEDKVYKGLAPDITMDGFEYGAILEKIRCDVDDFKDNPAWQLVKGQSYDPFVFNPPTVKAEFFRDGTTFTLDMSIADKQVKSAFDNPLQLSQFFSMIENRLQSKKNYTMENLTMRVINRLMATKLKSENNVVKLLTAYNTEAGTSLTPEQALKTPDFIKYANMKISLFRDYLTRLSMLYNDGGYVTFTPVEDQKFILLSNFARSSEFYLESDTYHNDIVKLQGYSTVPYWQGSGTDFDIPLNTASSIDVTLKDGDDPVKQAYIIGVIFDKKACGIYNKVLETTAQINAKARFTNYFHQFESSYFNDTMENCIVFTLT